MFEIQSDGRMLRVKPIAGSLQLGDDGFLVLDRVAARKLSEQLETAHISQSQDDEGEDG